VVTDETGQAAIGATIALKNSSVGAFTDENGEFELEIPKSGAVITVSYVGYETKELSVQKELTLVIKLEVEARQISEVVVVAYGTQKKSHLTGSVAMISTKDLAQKPTDNLTNMLAGRLPGLITRQQSGVPGENAAKFFIRGRSSPTGSGAPLVIVDGVERAFDNLDPNEIESISILKDAAAAATYGVRAANGVVMVTTKKGKEGQNLSLNFTSTFGMSTNTAFPEYPDGYNYALWHNKARQLDGQAIEYLPEDLEKIQNGDPDGILGNTEWTKMIFEPFGPQTYQNLNISGGNSKLRFFNNAAFLRQGGVIKGVSFDRVNLRSNVEYEVSPILSIGLNIAGRTEEKKQPGTHPGSQDVTINNYKNIVFYSILARPTSLSQLPDGTSLGWGNPLVARDKSGFFNEKRKVFQSTGTVKLKVPGVEGLSLRGNLSYDYENGESKWFIIPNRLATWDYGRRELVFFDRLMPKDITTDKNELHQSSSNFTRHTIQLAADYSRTIGSHALSGLLLFEEQGTKTSSFGLGAQDLPLTSLPDLNFATQYINNSLYGIRGQRGTRGLVARMGYIYQNKYLFEFTGRADWSPKFPKSERLGIFPSVSAGWNMAEENFFRRTLPFVTRLKLRGSVGILGNDDIGDFRYLKTFGLSGDPQLVLGNNRAYLDLLTGAVPNYGITWEKTTTYNAGLDLELWNGKLSVEGDVFYKVTTGILQNVAGIYPPSVGGNFPAIQNQGVMDARGVEVIVRHDRVVNPKFSYQVSGNFTFSRNRYIETDESPNIPAWQRRTGQPLGSVLGWVSDGLFQNEEEMATAALTTYEVKPGFIRYKDLNGDGIINHADRTWISRSPIPEIIAGLNLSVSYHKLNVALFFQGAARTNIMLTGEYINAGFSDGTFFTQPFKWGANTPYFILNNTWQKEGDLTEFPRLTTITPFNNNLPTDFWRRDASYIRLKNVEVSYPLSIRTKTGKSTLTVFASGTNLFTISKLKFIDPEAPTVSNGFYPQQKVYNFGINIVI
jgi:TonB-linked SusC/RagA family outer membrane protein